MNKERQEIVFNYLIENGLKEHVAYALSRELFFKSDCDLILREMKGGEA